ncbi:hypothetical protein TgHK011_001827 [Trichoderma gracile]|nr:hypothetical protein TgHK011_001827 [Trichoderma gracile]
MKRQRRRPPQRRPKATVTSPGQRYERQSAPPAKVPRALLGAKGAESGAPEEGPVPQRLPLRCQLGAGCPLLLSEGRVPQRASSPPNPTDGARGP